MEVTANNLAAFARTIERLADLPFVPSDQTFAEGQKSAFRLVARWIREDFSLMEGGDIAYFDQKGRRIASDRAGCGDQGVRPHPERRGEAGDNSAEVGADPADGAAGADRQGTEREPSVVFE